MLESRISRNLDREIPVRCAPRLPVSNEIAVELKLGDNCTRFGIGYFST